MNTVKRTSLLLVIALLGFCKFATSQCVTDSVFYIPSHYTVCGNDSTLLTEFATAGGTYAWYDNGILFATGSSPRWASAVNGPHIIRLIWQGIPCTDTFELTLIQGNALTADAGNGPKLLCPGDSVVLGGSPTAIGGNGSINYGWAPFSTLDNSTGPNPKAFPTTTTMYQVQLVDSIGCEDIDSIQVIVTVPPGADAGGGSGASITICRNDTATLGGSPTASGGTGSTPLVISWSPLSFLSNGTAPNPQAWPDSTTAYYLTVTDSLGCSRTDSIVVNVNQLPDIDTSSMIVTWGACDSADGSIAGIIVTGAPALLYQWMLGGSTAGTTLNINNLAAGGYSLEVTDGNGCKRGIGPINVGQYGNPSSGIVTATNPSCGMLNGQVTVSGVTGGLAPYAYLWSSGGSTVSTQTTVTALDSALLMLTVTDSNGCTWDTTFFLNRDPIPNVAGTNDSSHTWMNEPVTFDIGGNDTGSVSGIIITIPPTTGTASLDGAGNVTYTPNKDFTGFDFFYYLICDPSCPLECDTALVIIQVKEEIPLFVPTGFSPNEDGINDAYVILGIAFHPENTLTVYNRWGDVVYSASPYINDWKGISKNGNAVTDGTYYYMLQLSGSSEPTHGPIELRR